MNAIGAVIFDFEVEHESFARKLYGHWDPFFETSFKQIADELFTKYDLSSEHIEIKALDLNLGNFTENDFYEKFPLLIREQLEDALIHALKNPQQLGIIRLPKVDDDFEVLCQFLLHGRLSWSSASVKPSVSQLFLGAIKTHSKRFKQFLQTHGHYTSLRERVVYQFNDQELEQGVHLLASQEGEFICSYSKLLRSKHQQLQVVPIEKTKHRHVVWTIVYAYLLNNRGSYFDKKSFVAYTIVQLASKYNLSYSYLLDIITSELDRFARPLHLHAELWTLLSELRKELLDKNFKKSSADSAKLYQILAQSIVKDGANKINKNTRATLVHLLSKTSSCRIFIQQLSEQEIISLLPIVVPNESEFVISYAHALDVQNEKGGLEGKAGSEFRLLKWQLIFPLLLQNEGSLFSRKQFVLEVLQQITAHYNLDIYRLIEFIWRNLGMIKIDPQLIQILQLLYAEQQSKQERFLQQLVVPTNIEHLESLIRDPQSWTNTQQKQIIKALENIIVRKEIIDKLNEEEIQGLIGLLFPQESAFVCTYALSLEHQKAYGALQGRAGGEFHKIKWEFIFHWLAENKETVFNRTYFVASLLHQMASHYNLTFFELLEAFQNERLYINLPFGLDQILRKLYQQELKIVITQLLIGSKEEDKRRFFAALVPHEKEFVINYIKLLNRTNSRELISTKMGGHFQQLKWQFIFKVLLEMPRSPFNRKYFVRKTLENIAAHYNLKLAELIRYYQQEMKFLNKNPLLNLSLILDELHQEQSPLKLKDLDQKRIETKTGTEKEPLKGLLYRKEVSRLSEAVFVKNAGLVLLTPFIPRLFENLSLLDQGKFKDEEAQRTAIFLLQYLVFEQTEFAEHELFFNKLLVAYQAGSPIPRRGELSKEQQEMADSLVQGVLQHWEKLKSTSVLSFRESFLQREGKLEETADFWLLTVESKAFDMLLDSLPWNYSIIKHSWMEKAIQVKWSNN